jgi:uncharacterized membrane protein YgdD (TMEM256/DUF423 family)
MNCSRCWLMTGATLGGLAVVLGALAAHGLEPIFEKQYSGTKTIAGMEVPASWKYLQDFKTGAEYQMYHSLALLAVGLLALRQPSRSLDVAGWCFVLGILFFSGSLYVLTLTGQTWLGMIAPIGGTLMIVGWFVLAYACCSCAVPKEKNLVQPTLGNPESKSKNPEPVA